MHLHIYIRAQLYTIVRAFMHAASQRKYLLSVYRICRLRLASERRLVVCGLRFFYQWHTDSLCGNFIWC